MIYLYLFGTCFHFIYVFMIIGKYLYSGISPQEIADELGISVNTVRVQIKNAMDKMKMQLGSAIVILLLFLLKK